MRSRLALICCGLLLAVSGCNWFHDNILNREKKQVSSADRPSKEALVSYLNRESAKVDTLQVNSLGIEASMGLGVARSIALNGTLEAQKPRNFRMEGYYPGAKTDVVDLGSNEREFWFWVTEMGRSSEPPYLYHCSHTDLPKATLPLPVHPDWIMEALGMASAPVNPANVRMEFSKDGKTIELSEPTRSPQGQSMYKVTVFNARTVPYTGSEPQILSRKLVDGHGKLVCLAEIEDMQQDPHTKINVPHTIKLFYPSERKLGEMSLKLKLDNIAVNTRIDEGMASVWFTRPQKPGVVPLDIGRGSYRGQSNSQPPQGGGIFRNRNSR